MTDNLMKKVFETPFQPQVKSDNCTTGIMLDVIIALIPAAAAAVRQYGADELLLIAVSVVSAVFYEWLFEKIAGKSCSVGDLSACVTGLLLALTLPPDCPLWLPLIGNFFAVVFAKQLYGGIGCNFLNPALFGRAVLLLSYPVIMSTWSVPASLSPFIDGATMATPLSGAEMPSWFSLKLSFLGAVPGSLGETSVIALLAGGIYLLVRKVISWRIPVMYIGTAAALSLVFSGDGYSGIEWMLYNICSGGLLLGAIFMATDYSTSPATPKGRIFYGIGCGVLTVILRRFGTYTEGVTFAILTMNLFSWAIDKACRRVPFGTVKAAAGSSREGT